MGEEMWHKAQLGVFHFIINLSCIDKYYHCYYLVLIIILRASSLMMRRDILCISGVAFLLRTTIVSFKRGAVGKTNFSYHDEDQSKLIYVSETSMCNYSIDQLQLAHPLTLPPSLRLSSLLPSLSLPPSISPLFSPHSPSLPPSLLSSPLTLSPSLHLSSLPPSLSLPQYFNVTGSGVAPNSSGGGIAAGPIGLVIIFL